MDESVLELPGLSSSQIKKEVRNFTYNVYKQYDSKKAIKEKMRQVKGFIISTPLLYKISRPIYRLIKKI